MCRGYSWVLLPPTCLGVEEKAGTLLPALQGLALRLVLLPGEPAFLLPRARTCSAHTQAHTSPPFWSRAHTHACPTSSHTQVHTGASYQDGENQIGVGTESKSFGLPMLILKCLVDIQTEMTSRCGPVAQWRGRSRRCRCRRHQQMDGFKASRRSSRECPEERRKSRTNPDTRKHVEVD